MERTHKKILLIAGDGTSQTIGIACPTKPDGIMEVIDATNAKAIVIGGGESLRALEIAAKHKELAVSLQVMTTIEEMCLKANAIPIVAPKIIPYPENCVSGKENRRMRRFNQRKKNRR